MKSYSQAPEKFVVGAKCKVLLPVCWVGATVNDNSLNVWLPAVITRVHQSKRNKEKCPSFVLNVRASHKYKTPRIEGLIILSPQVESTIKVR